MYGLFDYTINSREDLKYINKDSKIKNLYIKAKVFDNTKYIKCDNADR